MDCPACRSKLRTVRYEGVDLDTCERCGGEFLSAAEVAHVVRTREQRVAPEVAAVTASLRPVFGAPAGDGVGAVRCPSCAGEMRPINYAGDTGVCVDRCDRCAGVWLEHEELEKIQALLERWQDESGGRLAQAAGELRLARERADGAGDGAFQGSRFAFVNALLNRLMDAA